MLGYVELLSWYGGRKFFWYRGYPRRDKKEGPWISKGEKGVEPWICTELRGSVDIHGEKREKWRPRYPRGKQKIIGMQDFSIKAFLDFLWISRPRGNSRLFFTCRCLARRREGKRKRKTGSIFLPFLREFYFFKKWPYPHARGISLWDIWISIPMGYPYGISGLVSL